jgi:hypothetical protein
VREFYHAPRVGPAAGRMAWLESPHE